MQQNKDIPRLHAQTLTELNYCVGTARRDAAYSCLCDACIREQWPMNCKERAAIYENCIVLVKAALEAAERTGLCKTNPRQALADKPLHHFLNLVYQQMMTLHFIAEHIQNIGDEAEILEEHLGEELFSKLEETCHSFSDHEMAAIRALKDTLLIGRELLESNSRHRQEKFSDDDRRRYAKAYAEFIRHYSGEIQ